MRVLFYLPVVTPWWFEAIIVPLVEKLTSEAVVHILAPIFWQGTGVGQAQYDLCAHLPQVMWHVVTNEDHRSMRVGATQRSAIVEFVRSLDPDVVLCRAADFETTKDFSGRVLHITEGAADPLVLPIDVVHFADAPFSHGVMPPLDEGLAARLDSLIAPYWDAFANPRVTQANVQSDFRKWANLPDDRPVLFLPLEYEHEENFYSANRIGPVPNVKLVEEVLHRLDGRAFLAMTNHPLNALHIDNSALHAFVESHSHDVALLPGDTPARMRTTELLIRASDGVFLGDSKTFSLAGFCGTPILRQSRFQTGAWLNASDDLEAFVTSLTNGTASTPDREKARLWFAYHVANNLVWPKDDRLTGRALIERFVSPINPANWEANLSVFACAWEKREEAYS